jgi:plasmid stabilization system protein ParE
VALKARWTREAEESFEGIIDYLQAEWSEKEVRSFVRKADALIRQIEKNPYQFSASRFYEIRRAVITKHTSLFYRVNEQDQIVELYSFWDNRRNPEDQKY